MHSLSEQDLLVGLIALALILALARAMAELARRIGQPEVLGELFAGFLIGPSVFGALLPSLYHTLFLNSAVSLVLSGMSWIGVILLLLMAGLEIDLSIIRQIARPGMLAAALAIVPSLIAGSLFAWLVFGKVPPGGLFLGIVLSVTGVSVAAKILMERGQMRRGYAQVIVAAGVVGEVLVWLFVSVVSAFHSSSPLLAGLLHAGYAIAFFLVMMTVGRRFVFWAMRRVRDTTGIVKGQLTFVLFLTFAAAAVTHALGLHALLGAFVVGVLISQAPRINEELIDGLRSLTLSFFAPIFFVLAGMRVDILKLGSLSAIATVLLLLVVATAVKVGFSTLGAKLGGQRGWESMLIGVGLNMKGGTDVVVAVIGTELGLLTAQAYTMYAVVAILTVFFSPLLIGFLEKKAPPTEEEQARLEVEEASRRSYVPKLERVLVPVSKELRGSLAASIVQCIASSKHQHGQIFDITELDVQRGSGVSQSGRAQDARQRLGDAGSLKTVELTARKVNEQDIVASVLKASVDYDLIAIGAHPPKDSGALSLGDLADIIIDSAEADVLVAIDDSPDNFDCSSIHRILVPTNGLEYSMAAADIGAALASSCDAEMVLFHAVRPAVDEQFSGESGHDRLVQSASGVLDELAFRIGRLGVKVEKCVKAGNNAGELVMKELSRGSYDLVVLGGIDRGHDNKIYLGNTIQTVLARAELPALLLVAHER